MNSEYEKFMSRTGDDFYYYEALPEWCLGCQVEVLVQDCIEHNELPYGNIVYVRNGYDKFRDCLIPIDMDPKPHLLFETDINLFPSDLARVMNFLYENKDVLDRFRNEKIDNEGLYRECKYQREILEEMATVKQQASGLKYKLWLDTNESFVKGGHWLRVKVQPSSDVKSTRSYATLTLPDMQWIGGESFDSFEKHRVEQFVGYNYRILEALAKKEITFDEFLNKVIRIDRNGEPVIKDQEPPFHKYKDAGFGYEIYVDKAGHFNYQDENGMFVLPKWYDICGEFKQTKDGLRSYLQIDGQEYYFYPRDWKFVEINDIN